MFFLTEYKWKDVFIIIEVYCFKLNFGPAAHRLVLELTEGQIHQLLQNHFKIVNWQKRDLHILKKQNKNKNKRTSPSSSKASTMLPPLPKSTLRLFERRISVTLINCDKKPHTQSEFLSCPSSVCRLGRVWENAECLFWNNILVPVRHFVVSHTTEGKVCVNMCVFCPQRSWEVISDFENGLSVRTNLYRFQQRSTFTGKFTEKYLISHYLWPPIPFSTILIKLQIYEWGRKAMFQKSLSIHPELFMYLCHYELCLSNFLSSCARRFHAALFSLSSTGFS